MSEIACTVGECWIAWAIQAFHSHLTRPPFLSFRVTFCRYCHNPCIVACCITGYQMKEVQLPLFKQSASQWKMLCKQTVNVNTFIPWSTVDNFSTITDNSTATVDNSMATVTVDISASIVNELKVDISLNLFCHPPHAFNMRPQFKLDWSMEKGTDALFRPQQKM
jgi:hypothetical protein